MKRKKRRDRERETDRRREGGREREGDIAAPFVLASRTCQVKGRLVDRDKRGGSMPSPNPLRG